MRLTVTVRGGADQRIAVRTLKVGGFACLIFFSRPSRAEEIKMAELRKTSNNSFSI
jgi:hypothetical protein